MANNAASKALVSGVAFDSYRIIGEIKINLNGIDILFRWRGIVFSSTHLTTHIAGKDFVQGFWFGVGFYNRLFRFRKVKGYLKND